SRMVVKSHPDEGGKGQPPGRKQEVRVRPGGRGHSETSSKLGALSIALFKTIPPFQGFDVCEP
ncbi:MAG: hypothetical protein RIE86_05490, partial [Imperialibacter sp.]|uniref:hypothetical protein n=1 Tax=Imperialibacter sp. TaxID=2038411 RepID=UPI0032EE9CB3